MNYIPSNKFFLVILILIGFGSCEKETDYLDPILNFEIQLSDSIAPANVYFLNCSVNLENFEWDFGDGTTSHEKSPNHFFNVDGEYTIKLKAWNDQEELTCSKSIHLSRVYEYLITNDSQFKLYNLTSYPADSSNKRVPVSFGILNAHESSDKCKAYSTNLYVSFENDEGLKFKTAFPFRLSGDSLNELIIDRYTLVVIDN
jgi:hypothetical protein